MKKSIYFIINPIAGTDEPILSHIARTFQNSKWDWDIGVTRGKDDVAILTKKAIHDNADIICVYGGDGTVSEVARILHKTSVPMAILPGGSANIIAKDLKIPVDTLSILKSICKGTYKIKPVDMLLSHQIPMLVGYVVGAWADVVTHTKRKDKARIGQLAYGLTALEYLPKNTEAMYTFRLDDAEPFEIQGSMVFIANVGNIGITGMSLAPNIKIDDELLDILVIQSVEIKTVIEWLHSTVTNRKPKILLKHWKCKKMHVTMKPRQSVLADDVLKSCTAIDVEVSPHSLQIVLPYGKV